MQADFFILQDHQLTAPSRVPIEAPKWYYSQRL